MRKYITRHQVRHGGKRLPIGSTLELSDKDAEDLGDAAFRAQREALEHAEAALRRLADALDRLPDRCREVVWLRRVEELSQKDVASRLGISEKTVEKHIAKGMRLLADALFTSEDRTRATDVPSDAAARREVD